MFAHAKVADKEATSFPPLKMYSIKPITTSLSEFEPPQNAIFNMNISVKDEFKPKNRP